MDLEDRRGWSGLSLVDSSQEPLDLHGLRGTDGTTGEVEGNVGECRHVLRLLDEVRDACRRQEVKSY